MVASATVREIGWRLPPNTAREIIGALENAEAALNTNVTGATGTTLTAAQMLQGIITRSGPTSAFSDTTDTAANLIAALGSPVAGQTAWQLQIINTTGFPQTILGGTGVTVGGLAQPIPANAFAVFQMLYTGAGAVSMNALQMAYNAAGGYDPSTVQTQFGSGTGTFLEEGNIYRQVSSAGINPGATGADNVLATFTIPANSFDGISNRGVMITAAGSVANNVNSKRIKLYWGCTTATVGSTVSGGTVIADTGAYTTTGAAGWEISANVFKYGAANSNTQIALHSQAQIGSTVGALLVPTALTATENAGIIVAVTGNAGTAATDIIFNWLEINAMN